MRAFAQEPKGDMLKAVKAIDGTRDGREEQADHIAEHVMRMPGSPFQRACPCGGQCPRCRAKSAGQQNGRMPIEAPSIVQDVLRTPGAPLDSETRRFMESRFGQDFSRVRVHADATSAESAKAVEAQAYTFGRDIVFGPGRYAPAASEGRWLLAHELAHVVQQADAPELQRKPEGRAKAKPRTGSQLEELSRDPEEAHKAWKKLTPEERDAVTESMRRRYGEDFSQAFLREAKKGRPQFDVSTYQPGMGPTREQLLARGFRRAGSERSGNAGFDVEVWVHPTGKTVRRDVSTWKFSTSEPRTKSGSEAGKSPAETSPIVKPPAEPPVTTARHEQALDFLDGMKTWNTAIHSLCEANPFNLSEAENAVIEWNFAREAVRDFKDLDWTDVYPEFWNEVTELADENLDLRAACCKRDPSSYWFDCGTLPKP